MQHEVWLKDNSCGKKADLSHMDLRGLNFISQRLIEIDMVGSCLVDALMCNTVLYNVDLSYSDLSNADLHYSSLECVVLNHANLTKANLRSSYFDNVDLEDADLYNADLTLMSVYNCDITKAKGLPTQEEILDRLFEKTNEGYIVYKTFGLMYKSPEYWKIKEGSIIEEELDGDRTKSCSYGINIAIKEWVLRVITQNQVLKFKGNSAYPCHRPIWKCLISFDDLDKICVPYSTDGKIRCGRLKLLETVK